MELSDILLIIVVFLVQYLYVTDAILSLLEKNANIASTLLINRHKTGLFLIFVPIINIGTLVYALVKSK